MQMKVELLKTVRTLSRFWEASYFWDSSEPLALGHSD